MDTSTAAVTAALHDGIRVIAESTVVGAQQHGELLAPQVQRVLSAASVEPNSITAVVVGVGPGPFTGLRVGVVSALTLGHTLGVPVYGVCSLDALALRSGLDSPFVVATDARRREVYWARYAHAAKRVSDAAVGLPSEVVGLLAGVPVIGPGAELYAEIFGPSVPLPALSAGALAEIAVAKLAAGEALLPPQPLYLRRPDATPPKARKSVLS